MGRIITVSDGAGRSVTVSNWGVAQSSRDHAVRPDDRFVMSNPGDVNAHQMAVNSIQIRTRDLQTTDM
jgi:hypothetical protein